MAKKTEYQFIKDLITPAEAEIVSIAREAERFTRYGWEKYGEDWKAHIPTFQNYDEWCLDSGVREIIESKGLHENPSPRPIINLFTRVFMNGFSFQQHQAEVHYCPIPDIQIMGGVGSGKTTPMVVSAVCRASLNPGYRVLWVAPILSQAKLAHDVIMQWCNSGRWGELFLEDHRKHPYPIITLRRWNKHDPGSLIECRSLGVDPGEMLRGGEYDEAVSDEAMRAYITTWYIALLVGRLRGPKQYVLNANPELSEQYANRVELIDWSETPEEREELVDDLNIWVKESGIAKETRITVIGNAPRGAEWWNRWEKGFEKLKPGEKPVRYSDRWTTQGNMYITRDQIELQRAQYEGREEQFDVELGAMRPPAGGDIFPFLEGFFDDNLVREATLNAEDEEKYGWEVRQHNTHGLYYYRKPPQEGAAYVAALDPGSGVIPHRNKWCLMVARIDKGLPFEIVYIQIGNLPGLHGSPDPWIQAAQEVRTAYPMAYSHFATESSGVQKNTHQVVWRDDLIMTPISLNNVMATLIIEAQRTVKASMWHAPYCVMFDNEMSEFSQANLRDKTIPQDTVSCFLILNHLVYPMVKDRWEPPQPENDNDYWIVEEYDRDIRDVAREVRAR